MCKALYQLRFADAVAARKFYNCRRLYMMSTRDPFRRFSAETTQELVECLNSDARIRL
jgi:hypothetical protein